MKKFIKVLILMLSLVFLFAGAANATLIGVLPQMGYPDIVFDNTGYIVYDSDTDSFNLYADDLKIAYNSSDSDPLFGVGVLTSMGISIKVDENGDLINCEMWEKVMDGEVTVGGNTYVAGTMLLAGEVTAFGWGEGVLLGQFDFIVEDLWGALITDGIWPDEVPTGIFAFTEELNYWTGSWDQDFRLDKVKGDKAPVPEPATMFLFGLGIIGLVSLGRKKLFKK